MRDKWHAPMVLVWVGLVASILACNAPTPTPQTLPPTATSEGLATLPAQETLRPSPTRPSTQGTPTSALPASTEPVSTGTPLAEGTEAAPTPSPTPTTPVSTGPLDFPVPATLDNWQPSSDGGYEATIILRITGGAPPYTVHHDLDVFTAEETNPAIVFKAQGCSALVHTIQVDSADGQSVKHDYWIQPPWCD